MSLKRSECFEILEIEPTSDLQTIKKAYAKAIRKYHPEENPEEYRKVRDAYEFLQKSNNWSGKVTVIKHDKSGSDTAKEDGQTLPNGDEENQSSLTDAEETNGYLEKEIEGLISQSYKEEREEYYQDKEEKLETQVVKLGLGKRYAGEKHLDAAVLGRIRRSPLYYSSLKKQDFIDKYARSLSHLKIDDNSRALIKGDLERVKVDSCDYSKLEAALEEKIPEPTPTPKQLQMKNRQNDAYTAMSLLIFMVLLDSFLFIAAFKLSEYTKAFFVFVLFIFAINAPLIIYLKKIADSIKKEKEEAGLNQDKRKIEISEKDKKRIIRKNIILAVLALGDMIVIFLGFMGLKPLLILGTTILIGAVFADSFIKK